MRVARLAASTLLSCLVAFSLAPAQMAQTADDARFPCRSVHTFDFWVGEFDATTWDQPTAPPTGQLHNTREYKGVASSSNGGQATAVPPE